MDAAAVDADVARAGESFRQRRSVPAQGDALARRLGDLLTRHKADSGTLISLKVGKITDLPDVP